MIMDLEYAKYQQNEQKEVGPAIRGHCRIDVSCLINVTALEKTV